MLPFCMVSWQIQIVMLLFFFGCSGAWAQSLTLLGFLGKHSLSLHQHFFFFFVLGVFEIASQELFALGCFKTYFTNLCLLSS
jgi:hypothetical protein